MFRLHWTLRGRFKWTLAGLLAGILTAAGLPAQSALAPQTAASPAANPQATSSPKSSSGSAAPSSQANPATSPAAKSSISANLGPKPTVRQKAKAQAFYLKGVRAMQKGAARAAEKDFARAAQEDPTNTQYDFDRKIARENRATELVESANRARIEGHPEIAHARLAEAAALDPKNSEVSDHLDELGEAASSSSGPTATLAPPIELAAKPGKQSFHIKGTERDIAKQVLAAYGLNSTFDSSVGKEFIHFNADDATFAQASDLLGLATGTFFVALDPRSVLIAKDTKQNHTTYDRLAVETLHFPELDEAGMTHVGDVIRNVFGIEKVSLQTQSGTITVRAGMPTIIALNRTLEDLLDGKDEILLDVRLFSIAKTKTYNIGLQPPQTVSVFNLPSQVSSLLSQNSSLVQQIISSGLVNASDTVAIAALLIASGQVSSSIFSQGFALFGGGLTESGVSFKGITANLSLNSTDTRALDDVQLRLDDQQEGTIKVGERYPIETSNYSSISASSVSIPGLTSTGLSSTLAGLGINVNSLASEAIPQVQYEDLGLTLTITPTVQQTNDIALKVDFKLTALQGTSLNGLPVLNNTSFSADVVVLNGASAMLVSDLTREESKALSGIPGLSELPGFQTAVGDTQKDLNLSDMVIVVTPHLIRRRPREDLGPYIPLPRTS